MDLTGLVTLKAIADAQSLAGAAARLNCVPSAVTARLRALESELGEALFVRQRRGVVPTPKGRILVEYAERAIALFEDAQRAVSQDAEPLGTLRVGATDTAATIYLPPVFAKFHQQHPDVTLEIVSLVSEELIAKVRDHALDCAIVNRNVVDPALRAEKLRRERLALVSALSVEDPFALPRFTFLAARSGGTQRARIAEWWAQSAHPPMRTIEMPSIGLRLSCAAAGMGLTVVPERVLSRMTNRGTVRTHPIPEPWCWLETTFVWPAESPSFAARRRFREILAGEVDETDAP